MAAAATDTKKELDDLVDCSICTQAYNDPRSLPCIHSYCFKCIADWCKDKQPGDKVACPLCRKEFTIPHCGVGDLPKNFFIGKLLKISELIRPETGVKFCDICSTEEYDDDQYSLKLADVFCLECQQNLCESCKKCHSKMKTSSAHTVVSLGENVDEIDIKLSATFCDQHQNKPIEIYCFDCKTTLCMMCHIEDHNKHKCSDVNKVAVEVRASLRKDNLSMTAEIHGFEEKIKTLQSKRQVFVDRVEKVERKICERADHFKEVIDDEKRKLLADLHEMNAHHEEDMEKLAMEITQGKSLIESLNKYCSELVEKGTANDVIREASNVHRRSEELGNTKNIDEALEDFSCVDVTFIHGSKMFDGTTRFLGEVINKGR